MRNKEQAWLGLRNIGRLRDKIVDEDFARRSLPTLEMAPLSLEGTNEGHDILRAVNRDVTRH